MFVSAAANATGNQSTQWPEKGPTIQIQDGAGFRPYDQNRLSQQPPIEIECISGLIAALRSSSRLNEIAPYTKNIFLVTNSWERELGLTTAYMRPVHDATYDFREKSLTLTVGDCAKSGKTTISAKDINKAIYNAWVQASRGMARDAAEKDKINEEIMNASRDINAIQRLVVPPSKENNTKISNQNMKTTTPSTPGKSQGSNTQVTERHAWPAR